MSLISIFLVFFFLFRTSGTPGRKRSSEERQVVAIPSLVTVPEVSNALSPLPAGLTESSSSGLSLFIGINCLKDVEIFYYLNADLFPYFFYRIHY